MRRKTGNIEEANKKIKKELQTLKSEIKQLQKCSNNFLTAKTNKKLAFEVREKLQLGVFSPAKVPRQKSPLAANSQKPNTSPKVARKHSTYLETVKENLQSSEPEFKSPHFPDSIDQNSTETKPLEPQQPLVPILNNSQCIEEIQNLEKENEILRKLHNLRKENQKLRKKVGIENKEKTLKIKTKSKKEDLRKLKKNFLEISTSTNLSRKSPLVLENQSCKYLFRKPMVIRKKSRVKGCRHSSFQIPQFVCPVNCRSASVPYHYRHHKSSSNFSFTDCLNESQKVCLKCKQFSRSFGGLTTKATVKSFSPSLTPRNRGCKNCKAQCE